MRGVEKQAWTYEIHQWLWLQDLEAMARVKKNGSLRRVVDREPVVFKACTCSQQVIDKASLVSSASASVHAHPSFHKHQAPENKK
jgi:hypothetical protein